MKLENTVVYKNSWEEFDIEHLRIKVKVTVGLQKFSSFTTIQTVSPTNCKAGWKEGSFGG